MTPRKDALWLHQVYTDHYDKVLRFLIIKTGNRALAEDLASETFLRAITNADKYTENNIGGWLHTIARNLFFDYVKSDRCKLELCCDEIVYTMDRVDPQLDPLNVVLINENVIDVAAVIRPHASTLNPPEKEFLRLQFIDELSIEEIAEAMGRSVGAVKALRIRVMRKLFAGITGQDRATVVRLCVICSMQLDASVQSLYCNDRCEQTAVERVRAANPIGRCWAPGCNRNLTVSQRRHKALACSSRCDSRLEVLRKRDRLARAAS